MKKNFVSFVQKHFHHFLILLFVLNLLDAAFTWAFVQAGIAKEVNPAMEFLLKIDYLFFFIVKTSIVFGACTYLWNKIPDLALSLVMTLSSVAYTALLINHLSILLFVYNQTI